VANVVDGVLKACEARDANGQTINVATGSRMSLNELLKVMNRLAGTSMEPLRQEPRTGDVKDSQADISKAKSLLGYQPTVSSEEGLERTLEWYRSERAAPSAGR
jgi:UDP-N-acetylglucosamine/UDP-N-acetyl-alpha-D-glucosaminouronate 4-epimerase